MGLCSSVHTKLNVPHSFHQNYFAIQLSSIHALRLILAPKEIIKATQECLASRWTLMKVNEMNGVVEFHLRESVWNKINYWEKIETKYFFCSLFERFYSLGWHLKLSTDLNSNNSFANVIYFHKEEVALYTSVICLNFFAPNKISILADNDVKSLIKECVRTNWSAGIEREEIVGQSLELNLKGDPWSDSQRNESRPSVEVPSLVTSIMESLFRKNWIFVSAINSDIDFYGILSSYSRSKHLNSLYFRYSSTEINLKDVQNTQFFSMSLNKDNRLRLNKANRDLICILQNTDWGIPKLWTGGIEGEYIIYDSYEFKLKGNAWRTDEERDNVKSKHFLYNLFNLLARYGYVTYATCNMTDDLRGKSIFVFRSKPVEPKSLKNMCVSINKGDLIQFFNLDSNQISLLREAIVQGWPKGMQREEKLFGDETWMVKLKGSPFRSKFLATTDSLHACVMMLFVLNRIENMGYRLICNGLVREREIGGESQYELSTWFFENA